MRSQRVKSENYQRCVCGKVCRGRAALANHGRGCPAERERAAAFIAAIESGKGICNRKESTDE